MADLPTVEELDELVDTDPLRLRDQAIAMRAEVEQLRATVARVRAAHPESDGRCTRCRMACDCWDQAAANDPELRDLEDLGLRWSECPHPAEPYPCPTIRALDGQAADEQIGGGRG